MFPFYSSCAYNKTKNHKRVENQSEINWRTFEVGYSEEGCLYQIQLSISSSIYKIHISFQVVLTRFTFVFKLY